MYKTKTKKAAQQVIPILLFLFSKWLSSSAILLHTIALVVYLAFAVMNRLTEARPCLAQLQSISRLWLFIVMQANSSLWFHVIIFLDQEGMSVFTAIVGIRLSYRDHSRHGNQGWCMVLSRPLHILEHWELVWKFSSLKIKMWQIPSFILSTFSSNWPYSEFIGCISDKNTTCDF